MKIAILTSSEAHPVYPTLVEWKNRHAEEHTVEIVTSVDKLGSGDLLILISCHAIVDETVRARYAVSVLVHASDLPRGRGWSPLQWRIVEKKNDFTVTLLGVSDRVDAGDIWAQEVVQLGGHELYDEINELLFSAEARLMDFAVENAHSVRARSQDETQATYYRKRTPEDSRVDLTASIASQFDLLRIADPVRFPAFFDFRGHRYAIRIEKVEKRLS